VPPEGIFHLRHSFAAEIHSQQGGADDYGHRVSGQAKLLRQFDGYKPAAPDGDLLLLVQSFAKPLTIANGPERVHLVGAEIFQLEGCGMSPGSNQQLVVKLAPAIRVNNFLPLRRDFRNFLPSTRVTFRRWRTLRPLINRSPAAALH